MLASHSQSANVIYYRRKIQKITHDHFGYPLAPKIDFEDHYASRSITSVKVQSIVTPYTHSITMLCACFQVDSAGRFINVSNKDTEHADCGKAIHNLFT